MKNNLNVCVVAGTHGDEYVFGSTVQMFLEAELRRGEACMLIGNPKASQAQTRFVDSDLNRAFGGDGTGYEAERAEEIKELFAQEEFTHVIDLHTSQTTHSIVPILPAGLEGCVGPEADRVINALPHIGSVVELHQTYKPYSLISALGQGGIALECPRRILDDEYSRIVADGILSLIRGETFPATERNIYKAYGYIGLEETLATRPFDDFRPLPNGGQSFVADPDTYAEMGYGYQGMRVQLAGVSKI